MLVTYENKIYDVPNAFFKVEDLESLDFVNNKGYVSNLDRRTKWFKENRVDWKKGRTEFSEGGELESVSTLERNDVTYQMAVSEGLMRISLISIEEMISWMCNKIYQDLREFCKRELSSHRGNNFYTIPVSFKKFTMHRVRSHSKYDKDIALSASGRTLKHFPNIYSDSLDICWGNYRMNEGFDPESMDRQFFSMIFNTDLSGRSSFLESEDQKGKVENLLRLRGYSKDDITDFLRYRGYVYSMGIIIICSFLGLNIDEFIGGENE